MAHESIVNLSEDSFETEVVEATVPVLVDFWAEWCAPCRMIAPLLDEIAEEKGDSVKITKVDIEKNAGLATKYGVRSIPTLLFFQSGELKETLVGAQSKGAIVGKLEDLAEAEL